VGDRRESFALACLQGPCRKSGEGAAWHTPSDWQHKWLPHQLHADHRSARSGAPLGFRGCRHDHHRAASFVTRRAAPKVLGRGGARIIGENRQTAVAGASASASDLPRRPGQGKSRAFALNAGAVLHASCAMGTLRLALIEGRGRAELVQRERSSERQGAQLAARVSVAAQAPRARGFTGRACKLGCRRRREPARRASAVRGRSSPSPCGFGEAAAHTICYRIAGKGSRPNVLRPQRCLRSDLRLATTGRCVDGSPSSITAGLWARQAAAGFGRAGLRYHCAFTAPRGWAATMPGSRGRRADRWLRGVALEYAPSLA